MGQPKLLLKFDGKTVIGRLVASLREGGAERVVVVAPPDDAAEGPAVAAEARLAGAEVVVPLTRPAADARFDRTGPGQPWHDKTRPKACVLTPGDYPGITAEIVAQLVEYAASRPESIIIPCHNGRRGHPIVLPWTIAAQIHSLPGRRGRQCARGRAWDIGHRIRNAQP